MRTPSGSSSEASPAVTFKPRTSAVSDGQLVSIGIKPLESRKAALFQLAAEMPPRPAELLGTTDVNAMNWGRLAAREWRNYIVDRSR